MVISVTLIIIIITCLVSFGAFSNQKMMDDLIFYPPAVSQNNQWYRFITCGFIHADIPHLIFNMYSFYIFGDYVEKACNEIFDEPRGKIIYVALYILALIVCLLPSYNKHKNDYYYKSLGASGAVSAIIFAGILLFPTLEIGMFFIPIRIPGFIFGPIYLGISVYLDKRQKDHINHSAHFWGAIFGVVFITVMAPVLSDFRPLEHFMTEVRSYLGK
ncbi:MAG: rhomboid family intrarane serine protease [Chitinophagaceae bacterium]|nr:rhomboid family intrarane serine protease [Chitinophagaceae bacterium]